MGKFILYSAYRFERLLCQCIPSWRVQSIQLYSRWWRSLSDQRQRSTFERPDTQISSIRALDSIHQTHREGSGLWRLSRNPARRKEVWQRCEQRGQPVLHVPYSSLSSENQRHALRFERRYLLLFLIDPRNLLTH